MPELTATLYVSSFCGACARTRSTLAAIAPLVGDRVAWREVDIALAPDEAATRDIVATPTVVFDDATGREVRRAAGVPSPDQVLAAIAAALPDPGEEQP